MTFTRLLAVAVVLLSGAVAQEPYLELLPKGSIQKPLEESVYVSCTAQVSDPELVSEMKWTGPNGLPIPNLDHSITIFDDALEEGKLELLINKLREQDTGEYICSAVYAGNTRLNASIYIESFVSVDFKDTPSFQTPIINTDAKIVCNVMSIPAPQVDWLKDGKRISTSERYIIQPDGILIKSIGEEDEGVYRCRAKVPELGEIKFRDIKVEVYVPPRITAAPNDTDGVENEAVTFQCIATGKPAPSYSWVDKDSRPLEREPGFAVDKITGQLTILDLKPHYAGIYRCTATNDAGEDTATANLVVHTKPKIERYLNKTVPLDENMEMRCIVEGSPMPDVIFKKETNEDPFRNGINADDRIIVEQSLDDRGRRMGILRINGIVRHDDGLYTCTAKSSGGETVAWGHITVEFPPTFEDQPILEFWSWEQEPVNLSCIATSIPNATVQWYLRNEEIPRNDPNLRVMSRGPTGILQVTPADPSYFGIYTCQATNRLGSSDMDVELKPVHKPGPISSSKVLKKTATTITWSLLDPTNDGGRPIQGYLAEYRLQDQSWNDAETVYWTKGSTYTVENLEPRNTYVFRFAARNEVGTGETGGEKVEQMPKRSEPEEPLIYNLKPGVNLIPYNNHYELQWQVPLDNGEPIDHFQIIYYQVRNTSHKWEVQGTKRTEVVEHPGATRKKLERLHSDSYYKIELRAHNEIGYSSPAEAIIKTAYDPQSSVPGSGPGLSVQYSSVAPSTTALAHGPDELPVSEGGTNVGVIVAVVVIVVVIVAIIIDVSCFFTNDAGVTAAIVGKTRPRAKDKEAMLEDGKTASVKSEGNGTTDPEKGSLKGEKGEKEKEMTEATETTPMIKGEVGDKEAILKEEQKTAEEENAAENKEISKDSPV